MPSWSVTLSIRLLLLQWLSFCFTWLYQGEKGAWSGGRGLRVLIPFSWSFENDFSCPTCIPVEICYSRCESWVRYRNAGRCVLSDKLLWQIANCVSDCCRPVGSLFFPHGWGREPFPAYLEGQVARLKSAWLTSYFDTYQEYLWGKDMLGLWKIRKLFTRSCSN